MSCKNKIKCLGIFSALVTALTGCVGDGGDMKTSEFFAMDTYISISARGEEAEEALRCCRREVEELEARLSVTDESSEIYKINQGAEKGTDLSGDTEKIIARALEISEKTEGALDISLYPVIREWGFTTGNYKIPDKSGLAKLLKNTGYEKVRLEDGRLTLPQGFSLDLGAVAKGYAGDKVIELLKEKGITSALVNLGGSISLLGARPDGSDWSIGIQNPFGDGYACVVSASGKAIVTSGNYQRYFEENGRRYCHIIDPKTGCPADNGLASVTVIGSSGLVSDGLSTALFVMGEEKAVELWREQGDFEMVIVAEDKRVLVTEGIFDNCTVGELGKPVKVER
ncbi:MAG TPA: FAD:protein FMN transferase [Ruminococcaceae bacterium]|nr:FAD:protein FMN transferase [Oscillospiraceae bacterium]